MSAQAQAHARNAASATLKDIIRKIDRFIKKTEPAPSLRLLESKLERLLTAKKELFDKHCFYAEKAGLDLATSEELATS